MKKYLAGILIVAALAVIGMAVSPKPTSTDTVAFNGAVEPSDPVPKWVGKYEYGESAPHISGEITIGWVYNLTLYLENGQAKAKLDIDGFQTMQRLQARIEERAGKLDLIFEGYGPGNGAEIYAEGDVLMSLLPWQDGSLGIRWGKLKSNLINPGQAVFTKIDAQD